MKSVKFVAVLAMMIVSFSAQAVCPVQETTVFYINGVDNSEEDARASREKLQDELEKHPSYNPDCIRVKPAYNHDEVWKLDLVQALEQKATEFAVEFSNAVGMLFRSVIPDDWFLDGVIDEVYSRNTGEVVDAQKDEHLVLYRQEIAAGKQIILVPHSQGGFYANAEWSSLTFAEQSNAHIVATSTPASSVADGGPYTTLVEDAIAGLFFPGALVANAQNAEPCEGDLTDRWTCHGFKESYLHGTNSRTQIVDDIAALLPIQGPLAVLKGKTFSRLNVDGSPLVIEPGVTLILYNSSGAEKARTASALDGTGQAVYRMEAPECLGCVLYGEKIIDGTLYCNGTGEEDFFGNTTNTNDFAIFPSENPSFDCGRPF
ncbi:hypothetical protein L0244_21010 [bacterium]|nr:hypothetical protein [bacterium]